MMKEAARACAAFKKRPYLIAVTVLTSMRNDDLTGIGILENCEDHVVKLARLARDSGLDGVVCSPREAGAVREAAGKKFLIVTPGVRPEWAARQDQARITTPREAVRNGADFVVIGRPIIAAPDPAAAARRVLMEM